MSLEETLILKGSITGQETLSIGVETRYEALLGFAESEENKALFTDMTGLD